MSSNGPGLDTQNPEHTLVAVEYVEEFVAQSDIYPLETTISTHLIRPSRLYMCAS